jgi:hypothetical protein
MEKQDILRMANTAFEESSFTDAEVLRFAATLLKAEREVIIDLVAFYNGPVDLEAAIRARQSL